MKGQLRANVPAAVRPDMVVTSLQRQGEWSLHLPFQTVDQVPSLNDRDHWAVRAAKAKAWRDAAHVLARAAKIPPCRRISIELHYVPATNQRRDPDNLVPALKHLADGLVDAKIIPDDTFEFVERFFPVIHPAQKIMPTRGDARFILRVVAL